MCDVIIMRAWICSQEADESTVATVDVSNRNDLEMSRTGTDALIEMGVKTGLSLIFSLLRQNWINTSTASSVNLCNDVLHTALDVVMSLPPLSLANESKLPLLGISTLNQVTQFLKGAVMPTSGADDLGRRLASQLVLAVAVQRGSLRYLLEWIEMSLCAAVSIQQTKMEKEKPNESDIKKPNENEHGQSTRQSYSDPEQKGAPIPYSPELFRSPMEYMSMNSPPGKISCDLFVEIVKQMKKTAVSMNFICSDSFIHAI